MKQLVLTLLIFCMGCGYSVHQSKKSHLLAMGLNTIYIEPFKNQTYYANVDTVVYNSIIKSLASQGVRLTKNKKNAQAVLIGTITRADYKPAATTTSSGLLPTGQGRSDILVASTYDAILSCYFALNRTQPKPKQPIGVWNSNYSRGRSFSAGTRLGVLGTTSALINDSEFEKAVGIMAESMAKDVHLALTSLF